MTMTKTYKCDICNDAVKPAEKGLLGARFGNLKLFTLGEHCTTEGTHICYDCAVQLSEQLNRVEIKELLGIK